MSDVSVVMKYAIKEKGPGGKYLPFLFPQLGGWEKDVKCARLFPTVQDACYVIASQNLNACTIVRVAVGGVSFEGEVS